MAFFKSFQQSLPSVTSILDSVSSKVDDLATAVSDVTYTVSDQLTEQVNTIINKVQTEEEERARKEEAEAVSAASAEDERRSRKLRKQDSEADRGEYDMGCSDVTSTPGLTEEGRRGRKEEKNRSKGKRNADVDDDEEERRERDRKEEEKKKEEDEWEWCYAPSKGWYRKKKEQSQNVTAQPSEEQQNVKSHQEFREEESANVETSSDVQHNQTINGLIQSNSQEELTSEEKHGSPNMSNTATKKKKKRQNSIEDEEDEDQEAHTSRTTAKKTSKAYTEESNEDDRPDKGANISGVSVKKNGKGYVEEDEDEEYSERKQSRASTKKNGKAIIEEEQEEELHGKQVKRSKRVCTEEEEDNEAPEKDLTELSRLTTKKKKEKGYTEEKRRQSTELGTDNEIESDDTEMYSPAKSGKWGKSMEKKSKSHKVPSKEEAKGSTEPRGKEKSSKKNGKERDRLERGSSDSEDERPRQCPERASRQRKAHGWDNRDKCSADKDGYGSEDSTGKGSVQKTRRSSPLNELQPPPYQDKDSPRRGSRGRSESVEGSEEEEEEDEEASGDPEDTENYLSKGPEEEAPSESTAVLGPEDASVPPLPEPYEPETLGKYGTLDVAFEYNSGEQRLAVTVTAATDIPALKSTGNISWQVHLVLLPTKKQRAKTGVQKGPCPVFTETFRFSSVEQEALADYAVRFRLYSVRRMKKEKVLGEKVFHLTKLNPQGKMALPVTLEPGSTAPGCGSMVSVSRSAGALSYRSTGESSAPELLLGLHYNSTTGRLSAEVIKGSHFKTSSTDKPPNTYVKLIMLDSKGKEMSKCKTSMCRGQPNPIYKETFVFQVALFQLSEVTLQVAVYSKRSGVKRRARLGWVSLGLNNSTEEQEDHWAQMREAQGQQVCQWHALLDT